MNPYHEIVKCLGHPFKKLRFNDIDGLNEHIVYAVINQQNIEYIGVSENGIARPLSKNHDKATLQPGDSLWIWKFNTAHESHGAESLAIQSLKPKRNGEYRNGSSVRCKRCDTRISVCQLGKEPYCKRCINLSKMEKFVLNLMKLRRSISVLIGKKPPDTTECYWCKDRAELLNKIGERITFFVKENTLG